MNLINPLNFIDIFANWIKYLNVFWNNLNTPIYDLVNDRYGPGIVLLRTFLDLINQEDLTLLQLMLGAGLAFYLVWQLFIWFFNLIT